MNRIQAIGAQKYSKIWDLGISTFVAYEAEANRFNDLILINNIAIQAGMLTFFLPYMK